MTVADVLAPLRQLPDWLVAVMDPVRVADSLTNSVPELSEGRRRVERVDPGRARLKQDRWTVRYEVAIASLDDSPQTLRLLGTLVAPGRPAPSGPLAAAPLGSSDWRCWLADLRLDLVVEPPDDELPALPLLTDPARSRALLEAAIAEQSPAHRGLRIATCEPQVLRY